MAAMTSQTKRSSSDSDFANVAGMSSTAVEKKTGRGWAAWIKQIDRAGGKSMSHTQIAAWLHNKQNVPGWWSQMITVGYEQVRHGRAKHQKPDGYEISATKTVNVPIETLYKAWATARSRKAWLPEWGFTVRTSTPNKSMRITWIDGTTHVDVYFNAKTADKSQVAVQHRKLKNAKAAETMKTLWKDRLTTLKHWIES